MVLSAVGADHDELLAIAEPLFSDMPKAQARPPPASKYVGGDWRKAVDSPITHVALAFEFQGGWRNLKDAVALSVLQVGSLSSSCAVWIRTICKHVGSSLPSLIGYFCKISLSVRCCNKGEILLSVFTHWGCIIFRNDCISFDTLIHVHLYYVWNLLFCLFADSIGRWRVVLSGRPRQGHALSPL
jgi:hypothetical protein